MKKILYLIPLLFFFVIPSFAHADVCTSGWGQSGYNGTWAITGTEGGKPQYTIAGVAGNYLEWSSIAVVWAFGDYNGDPASSGMVFYASNGNVATPDLSTGWYPISGASPAGTITAGGCSSPPPPAPIFIQTASSTCQYFATSTPSGTTYITLAISTCQSSSTPNNINTSTSSPLLVLSQDNGDLLFGLGIIVFILSVFFTGYLLNQFKYHDTH